MNKFDAIGLAFFNQFAFHSLLFDEIVIVLANQYQFKGVILVALLWWAWFELPQNDARGRELIVMTIIGGLFAVVIARVVNKSLPFRPRPFYNLLYSLSYPYNSASPPTLEHWSAFPSDHATLWFAIAIGVFLVSRKAGIFALLYTLIFICLPRIYLGLHQPTDIIGGGVIGTISVLICTRMPVCQRISGPIVNWSYRHPSSFYMFAFLLSYSLGTQFNELHELKEAFTTAN